MMINLIQSMGYIVMHTLPAKYCTAMQYIVACTLPRLHGYMYMDKIAFVTSVNMDDPYGIANTMSR